MKKYLLYILLLLCFPIGYNCISKLFSVHNLYPSKEEFYAKHSIKHNTLIPASFNDEECKQIITKIYDKYDIEKFLEAIKDCPPPEQYEGFYPPKDKIIFYNVRFKDNLYKSGLSDDDIKELDLIVSDEMLSQWHMKMSEEELEKEGFYSALYAARLVARVGENIYLKGDYEDCGTAGCTVQMLVRDGEKWRYPRVDLVFNFCKVNDDKSIFECVIAGGYTAWDKMFAEEYKPYAELLDRYYEVYADYVYQYLQRKN